MHTPQAPTGKLPGARCPDGVDVSPEPVGAGEAANRLAMLWRPPEGRRRTNAGQSNAASGGRCACSRAALVTGASSQSVPHRKYTGPRRRGRSAAMRRAQACCSASSTSRSVVPALRAHAHAFMLVSTLLLAWGRYPSPRNCQCIHAPRRAVRGCVPSLMLDGLAFGR